MALSFQFKIKFGIRARQFVDKTLETTTFNPEVDAAVMNVRHEYLQMHVNGLFID